MDRTGATTMTACSPRLPSKQQVCPCVSLKGDAGTKEQCLHVNVCECSLHMLSHAHCSCVYASHIIHVGMQVLLMKVLYSIQCSINRSIKHSIKHIFGGSICNVMHMLAKQFRSCGGVEACPNAEGYCLC